MAGGTHTAIMVARGYRIAVLGTGVRMADVAAVRVSGLCVVRGRREVLRDLSLTVARGQVTGLIGPSGCGKTTLIRAIVGTQIVAGGEVLVLDRSAGTAQLRHEVAYMTQTPSVYRDLTVSENLDYFAAILGAPAREVERVIAEVDLADNAQRVVGTLSGGEQSRVSLAAALLGSPRLLLLDEPTVGLDPVLRAQLWDLFARLADSGVTLLVSSHVMDEAARCDHVLLMRDGALLASARPKELLARTGQADLESAFLLLIESAQS
jgi:ABC-2 type transport system ATP-binding protein